MAYSKDIDYQAKINEAVAKGDYQTAAKYEQSRNEKIDEENLSYQKTNKYSGRVNGVDDATTNKLNSSFSASKSQSNAQSKANNALSSLEELTSKKDIISSDVWNDINSQFVVPGAVTEADAYLKTQLEKIQSGKTSYSDQVKAMIDKITGREKFSYDVDTDPLFQQALASAMNSGKQAMQDTIGQASALTGGYGSTYATTAGNQAYNAFIEDAYDNLPQYYQMALEAYQAEGDEMYRQYSMLSDADSKEYERNIAAYDATYSHRNQMYNEAYGQFRDNKSDAFTMANLQLSEHGQKVSDAYNYYNASADYADTLYSREFDKWNAEVNQAMQYAQMLSNDWWNRTNFYEGVRQYEQNYAEDVRQFETSFAENQRQFEANYAENQRQFNENLAENKRQYDTSLAENQRQFNETMAYNKSKGGSSGGGGSRGSAGSSSTLKNATESQMKKALDAYNTDGMEGLNKYLNSVPDTYDKNSIAQYVGEYGELPLEQRTYTKTKDTWNGLWGVDGNDIVEDQYGNSFKVKELPESIQKSLTNLKEGKSYTKK